jgi:hypothetical protein
MLPAFLRSTAQLAYGVETSYPYGTTETSLSIAYATVTTVEIATAPPGTIVTTVTGKPTSSSSLVSGTADLL